MHAIDQLPFPLNTLVAIVVFLCLPITLGIFTTIFVWKKSRAMSLWSRSGLRGLVLALFFAPSILLATSPGLHGAIPVPYFAWASFYVGMSDHNQQALLFGIVPIVVLAAVLWLVFDLCKLR